MPGPKPIRVVLTRPNGDQTIEPMTYQPPLRGVVWGDLPELPAGHVLTVLGGVTSVKFEYNGGDWMSFDVAGCDDEVFGVVWADATHLVENFDDKEKVDPNQPQWVGLLKIHKHRPGAAPPDGCYIIGGKVWCPGY